jgi:hypothetical protein
VHTRGHMTPPPLPPPSTYTRRSPQPRTTEEFSYFTLLRKATDTLPATSLFGVSCTRQLAASKLKNKAPDVTRSTVQKAVIVITAQPQRLGQLRERLSAVTTAWFAQGFVTYDPAKA